MVGPDIEDEGRNPKIAGRTVTDWDARWEHIPNGFKNFQPSLRVEPGLFAVKQGSQMLYIGAAVQLDGGLRAGLARGRLKAQTGNSSHGMRQVREAAESVETYVIRMKPPILSEDIVALKWAMIDLHKPRMNAPRDIVTAARKSALAQRSQRL